MGAKNKFVVGKVLPTVARGFALWEKINYLPRLGTFISTMFKNYLIFTNLLWDTAHFLTISLKINSLG